MKTINKGKRIKILEIISRILLIVFCIFIFYNSFYQPAWEIVCSGREINWLILISPLIGAIIIEIIANFKRKKYNLQSRKPINFLYFLFFSLIFAFIFSFIFLTCCGNKEKAIDARRMADLVQISTAQKQFFQENARYANSLEELVRPGYFSGLQILEEAERYEIIFENTKNPNTWRAYAFIKRYKHEICSGLKEPKYIYVCDERDCREEIIK